MADTLTVSAARTLGKLIDLTDRQARIVWLNENERDGLSRGTLRGFYTDADLRGFAFDLDVRDAVVRITTSTGFELAMPVQQALALIGDGLLAEDR